MRRLVIVGGGIAAVRCVEELCRLCPDDDVTLVSSSQSLKCATNTRRLTRFVEEFEVEERALSSLPFRNLKTVQATAASLGPRGDDRLLLADGSSVPFDRLCICTGATPKKLADNPHVLVLRDQDTVEQLSERLARARRVVLVGNGGIALELAYFLQGIEVVWLLKHSHIGDAFFDVDAAGFLRTELDLSRAASPAAPGSPVEERQQHGRDLLQQHLRRRLDAPMALDMHRGKLDGYGHAVGPHWVTALAAEAGGSRIMVEADCEIDRIDSANDGEEWPVRVTLASGAVHDADFVIAAVGVAPNTSWLRGALPLAADGGILVDRRMETGRPGVFAAGDACSVRWNDQDSHWFQMRLWTQARAMGAHAAHCMAGAAESEGTDFAFELFTHATRFLGKKVVLLGRYNGQGVPDGESRHLVSYSRSTEGRGSSFVRVLLLRGHMIGAVLIGDTGLEDAFENLILDGLDLSGYGPALLDPDMEVDHVFD